MSIFNKISNLQQKTKNEITLLENEVSSFEQSITAGLKIIAGNLVFIQEILEAYDYYIDDIADNKSSTLQKFNLSIEKYMDLSAYFKSFSKLLTKKSEDAQIKRVLLQIELEKEISKWIQNNLDYLNKYLSGYIFYLKEEVKIEQYKLNCNKIHVKVTFSLDIK